MSQCGLDSAGIAQAIFQRFPGVNSAKAEVNAVVAGK
jgi:hypothetical protein